MSTLEDILKHYGTKRKSGRYPWGSGVDPMQSESGFAFLREVGELRAKGLSDTEVASKMGLNTTQFRNSITWANKERTEYIRRNVAEMEKSGMTNTAIGKALGISERTVANYRNKGNVAEEHRKMQLDEVTDAVREGVEKTGYLDVGVGVERQLGVSRNRFNTVVNKLASDEGYSIHNVYNQRLSDPTGKTGTTIKVLTKDPDYKNTLINSDKIATLQTQIDSDGKISNISDPIHINLDRVKIRYGNEGGADKDGLIELRPGVDDLDLGNSKYAQVRIAAGDDLYLKGMVAYSDPSEFPKGVDIIFNTPKGKDSTPREIFKVMEQDSDNPFGANIVHQKGALNIVNEEGDWDTWSTTMSSQFLSKQPVSLIKERLDDTYKGIRNEYEEIDQMTNPVVKKYLMDKYIEGLDSKAKHLKAKGMPGTKSHVLLPIPELKPNEVFAPNYKNGDRVVLVRHPHGGRFEIPELVVNNKLEKAIQMIGNTSPDAIGIHPSRAAKLSGADFDGDTVLVIPNNSGKVKTSRSLKELKNFDPNIYKVDYDTISSRMKHTQMGIVSNLITDMTIKGASDSEIARAVRHSMVVIDSEKHKLNYKQSAIDNGITALVNKYQLHTNPDTGKASRGASTLVSRSKRLADDLRKSGGSISDPDYNIGKYSSGTAVEDLYVDFVNKIAKTKNEATKNSMTIPRPKYSREAARVYEAEVKSLNAKLNTALLNAPRERQAQILTNKLFYSNVKPNMDKDDVKKLKARSLARARNTVGAKKSMIKVTPTEWEAIQARALSNSKLTDILKNADMDTIRKHATPRVQNLGGSKLSRARDLLSRGYTYAEVAQVMGVTSTILRQELSNS